MKAIKRISMLMAILITSALLASCGREGGSSLTGNIRGDGSSTVGPITQAVAEEFSIKNPNVNISVGTSGTGGGFKKFTSGEIDVANASRKIKKEEEEKARANNIDYVEFEVAYDGIAVVVSKQNTWATDMTPEELNMIWGKDAKARLWSDVRPEWPKEVIKLYSPGTDSGTFEYFTEAINHKAKEINPDITASEDDNVLVTGVAGDKYAMGYFGLAFYEENADKLNLVKVNGITPSAETVMKGTYKPLSRPLFMYVNRKSFERPEVKEFLNFYLTIVKDIVEEVGYIPLEDEKYQAGLNKLK